jgi:glutamate N-acetyltransferase/amino-acid N-acetyltransferase
MLAFCARPRILAAMAKLPEVRGFRFAAVAAGIKKKAGVLDLALAVADKPVNSAAVFTQNLVQAAPVRIARERVAGGKLQAVLVNAGNANACTGKPGMKAALDTTRAAAEALGIDEALVMPASTGVIGQLLPSEKVVAALPALVKKLAPQRARDFSTAIMTTDLWPKRASRTLRLGGKTVTVLGMAKGAGMIHPRMATTLAFVFTDATASSSLLAKALRDATDHSFNVASVDGETSTNDTILLMASGASGAAALKPGDREHERFVKALREVLRELAESIVADGEGANHVAEIEVRGLKNDVDARTIAQRIATSLLVKTALHGKDANWGRILSAAGMAGVPFDPEIATIAIEDVTIVKRGLAVGPAAEAKAQRIMAKKRYTIRVTLGKGPGRASYLTCDLGHSYVDVNAGYRS